MIHIALINTEYTINGQTISYEILENDSGYIIYRDGDPWIKQETSGYIPFKADTMAESALLDIQRYVNMNTQDVSNETKIEKLEYELETVNTKLQEVDETNSKMLLQIATMMVG